MSVQRRRGQVIKVWPRKLVTDSRGNKQYQPDLTVDPSLVKAAVIPQRSSKAEVPGQQEIDVVNILVDPSLVEDIGLWARVEWNGSQWDIAAPPQLRYGVRRTRHLTIPLRRRPSDG